MKYRGLLQGAEEGDPLRGSERTKDSLSAVVCFEDFNHAHNGLAPCVVGGGALYRITHGKVNDSDWIMEADWEQI